MSMKHFFCTALGIMSLGASLAAHSAVCSYSLVSEWNTGFTATVTITNNTPTKIQGWELGWQFATNKVAHFYNANIVGANPYKASALGWNSDIKPGGSVSFGFNGVKNGGPAEKPVLTGSLCGNQPSSVKSSSVASSSLPGCVSQCNWYGKTYKLCETAATGWGWEHNANCVSRAACSGLSAPLGIITVCPVPVTSSSLRSSASSLSSIAYTSASARSSAETIFNSSQRSSTPSSSHIVSSANIYSRASSSSVASSIAVGELTREQASRMLIGTFQRVVNGAEASPGTAVVNNVTYDYSVQVSYLVNSVLSRSFVSDDYWVAEDQCDLNGVKTDVYLLPPAGSCPANAVAHVTYSKLSDTHLREITYCDDTVRSTTDYLKLQNTAGFNFGAMTFAAPGYPAFSTSTGVCGSTYLFNMHVASSLPLPPELGGLTMANKNKYVFISSRAPLGDQYLNVRFQMWGIESAADVTPGTYQLVQGIGAKGDFNAVVEIGANGEAATSYNFASGTLSVSAYSATSFVVSYQLQTVDGEQVEGTTALSLD